jgi:hypothetical protein
MWENIWQLFVSFYSNPSSWGIGIALVLGVIWLGAFAPPVHKRPWLWAVLAGGAIIFGPTIAFVQVPLQFGANQALLHFWDQATLQQHLLLAGIPAMLFTGLVQEGLKLVPPLVYMRRNKPLSDRSALILGAVAGAGFGIIPFWERFSAIGFHTGATALAIYGWNKGKGWQFYLLVALLHIILDYSVILLAAHVLTMVQVEIYASVLAVTVVAPALWLRWRKSRQESGIESISSGSDGR